MIQSKGKSCLMHKMKTAVKTIDNYTVPVTLTFKNKVKFRTVAGGILTIISRMIIFLFFLIQIPEVVNKDKTVQHKTVRVNLDNDNDPFILNKDNFDIAVRVYSPYGPLSDEMKYNRSKYFKFEFAQLDLYPVILGNKTIITANLTVIENVQCTNDRLGNLTDTTAALQLTSPEWVCPKIIDQKLYGSITTPSRSSFQFRVVPCNQASQARIANDNVTCASDSEIEKAINNHFIQIIVMTQYFDENEFGINPVKKEIQNLMQNIAPNISIYKPNLYQRVNITTMDSWFGSSFDNKQYSYYQNTQLANAQTGSIKTGIYDMVIFVYSKYNEEKVIVRRVTSLMDILSNAGGFSSVVMFVSLLISKLFQQQLFEKSLIKKIFKEQHQKSLHDLQSSETSLDLASSIFNDLKERRHPQVFYKQYFYQTVRSLLFCRRKRNNVGLDNSKLDVYTQNLHSKIDIVSLIKNVSQVKMIQEIILTRKQRQLLPYLNLNLIKPNDHLYYKRLESLALGTALEEDQLFKSIEKMIGRIPKSKSDMIFLSYLANIPIDSEILRRKPMKNYSILPEHRFNISKQNKRAKTGENQKSKRNLLDSSRKKASKISMNDTNKSLIKRNLDYPKY